MSENFQSGNSGSKRKFGDKPSVSQTIRRRGKIEKEEVKNTFWGLGKKQTWEEDEDSEEISEGRLKTLSYLQLAVLALLMMVLGGGSVALFMVKHNDSTVDVRLPDDGVSPLVEAGLHYFDEVPIALAKQFLAEPDPQKRLEFVRNRDEVATYFTQFDEQAQTAFSDVVMARSEIGVYADQKAFAPPYKQFIVGFPDGSGRLLAVVATKEGSRVDWDCYARRVDPSWDVILNQAVEKASVRVVASYGRYYNYDYKDDEKWVCFILSSPDLDDVIHGYALRGSITEELLTSLLASRIGGGSPFVNMKGREKQVMLEISATAKQAGRKQYRIDLFQNVGWVKLNQTGEDRLKQFREKNQQE